jgi:hypothetical protein
MAVAHEALPHSRSLARDLGIQTTWLAVVASLSFLIPYIFTSMLSTPHDGYYLIYFAVVVGLLWAYSRSTGNSLISALQRNWQWSLLVGVPVAIFAVFGVFRQDDATAHPDGLYFLFEILWRGLAYGVIDALLLSAFPGLIAFALVGREVRSIASRALFFALTIVLSVALTATYHLGYEHYREDGLAEPETGNVAMTLPTALTTNPLGSIGAHVALHLTAVTHSYETETFLPPQTDAD